MCNCLANISFTLTILLISNCNFVVYTAPVCFNLTGCEGEVGNQSISFAECCFGLSAVSYASRGRCLRCPTTGNILYVLSYKYRC